MARSVVMALVLAATSVAASPACTTGPGREDGAVVGLRTRLCDVAQECGCGMADEICRPWQSFAPRGAFDDECLEPWLQWADALECGVSEPPAEARLCPLYHGTILEGMPCGTSILGFDDDLLSSDCGAGLVCVGGACRDPEALAFGGEGQSCDVGGGCDPGLYCREPGTCERRPGRGEACPDGVCASPYVCDDVCLALPGEGQPCLRGQCAPGLSCEPLGCTRKAAVGEPCFGHRECVSGNCPAGFCAPEPQPGDSCSGMLPCGPGQACIDRVCEQVAVDDDGGTDVLGSTCELLWSL